MTGPWDVVVGNASEPGAVMSLSRDINHIIYAAGNSLPSAAEADPIADLTQSAGPLFSVIDACRQRGCGLTLLSSGGAVYGKAKELPIPEDHPTNPLSAYGIRNLWAEKYASMCADRFGINLTVFRISNVYGARQPLRPSQGIIPALLHCAAEGRPVTVYGDGRMIRDYIHAPDVASAVLDVLALLAGPRVVNLGSGRGLATLDLIAICNSVTGKEVSVRFEHARAFDVEANILDVSLLRRLIEFNPVGIESAIQHIWHRMATGREAPFRRPSQEHIATAHAAG